MRTDLLVSSCSKIQESLFCNRTAHGKDIRAEWNSGCGRPKPWQELTALNAHKVLGKLPDLASWASNSLMEHRSGIFSFKLSKAEDGRLGRWTSVGCSKQVVERAEGCPHDLL